MTTVAMLFAGLNEHRVPELTAERTMASVPFGCRYRLIDFALSNLVNAGITKVGVLTHYNYQSLMDHLGTGKDWDLARRNGGIQLLPPYVMVSGDRQQTLYTTRLEALISAKEFLEDRREDLVLLSDCDLICNMDLSDMIRQHTESGADITVAVTGKLVSSGVSDVSVVHSDPDGRILNVTQYNDGLTEQKDVQMHIMVADRRFLLAQLIEASAHGYTSIARDILSRGAQRYNYRIYRYEGYYETIGSISEYYARSMELLDPEVSRQLFRVKNFPVLTKVRNSVPTTYSGNSLVKNSLIADGCVIEGIVENSILFRGVHIGKNTSVENCIIMQDSYIGNNSYLNCVITDKNVTIRDGRVLSGHQNRPFYIQKNAEV